jgi:hypothetical protein
LRKREIRKRERRRKRDIIGWDKGSEGDNKMNRYGDGDGDISLDTFNDDIRSDDSR